MDNLAEKLWSHIQENMPQHMNGSMDENQATSLKNQVISAVEDVVPESDADLHLRIAELEDIVRRQQNQSDLLRGQVQRRDAEAAEMRRSHYRQVIHLQEQLYRQQNEDGYMGQLKSSSVSPAPNLRSSIASSSSSSLSSRRPSLPSKDSSDRLTFPTQSTAGTHRPDSAPPSGERLENLSRSDVISVSKHTKLMQTQRRKMLEEMKRMEIDFEKKLKDMKKSWEKEYERQKEEHDNQISELYTENQELEDRVTNAHRIIDDLNDQIESDSQKPSIRSVDREDQEEPRTYGFDDIDEHSEKENDAYKERGSNMKEDYRTPSNWDSNIQNEQRTDDDPSSSATTSFGGSRKERKITSLEETEDSYSETDNEWNTTTQDPELLQKQMIQMERELQHKSTVIRSLKMRLQRQSRSRYAEYSFDQPSITTNGKESGHKVAAAHGSTDPTREREKETNKNYDPENEETPVKSRLVVLDTNEGKEDRHRR
eukprot:gb/GECH01001639.1/.p1 GENE.gb/GECH01001639.1/~~gb/GECH01001639.1/.p1  ORF type:complete len:484 (+),score=132.55 gb/GECH01001639.1/:1-1452(+)